MVGNGVQYIKWYCMELPIKSIERINFVKRRNKNEKTFFSTQNWLSVNRLVILVLSAALRAPASEKNSIKNSLKMCVWLHIQENNILHPITSSNKMCSCKVSIQSSYTMPMAFIMPFVSLFGVQCTVYVVNLTQKLLFLSIIIY